MEGAVVNSVGTLLGRLRIATNSGQGADAVITNMIELIGKLLVLAGNNQVSAIGIGVAGQIDKNTAIVIHAPNLKWHNVDLTKQLTARFEIPVAVCNDVRAAAWGEWLCGAGIGCNNLVNIFVGTGVGGAIICNGYMVDGHNNTAGEIGHIVAQINGPLCTCGNKGCLEAIAGGWAIQRDAKREARNNPEGGRMLIHMAGGDVANITAETVVKAALKQDMLANTLVDNATEALIASITSIINTVGPQKIILGGGIIEGMPQLINRIEERVKKNALSAAISNVDFGIAALRGNAGTIGAALFALRSISILHKDY